MRTTVPYLDFDLLISRAESGYRAQVLSSPAGEATANFAAPFSELELENFVLRIGRPRRGLRRISSPEMEAVRTLGKGLYDAVFSGDVRACWRACLNEAEAQNTGLRLRLRIADAPELNDVPWEYLYNAPLNRFFSLSEHTPLVRYLDLPERIRPLTINTRLRILVMISSPTDYPGLDVEYEWSRLNEALGGLIDGGQVRLDRLAEARLGALQRALRLGEYHVLHFIGHGGFDPATQDGVLVLCDEAGKGRRVTAEHLGTLLHDHRSLRLAVLNACEGSRASRADPLAGVAQTLVQQGVPAAIAMQFEITDEAAITFSDEFYAATADGYPVDAALAAARKAIFAAGNDIEWGTPVLYLRAPDGCLFSVNREAARRPEDEKRAEAARQAEEEKQRAEAARQAEEEQRRAEAARQAEEEQRRAEAARQAEEENQRAEAARQAEEEQRRAEAARQAEEENQRAEAARQAEEENQRADAARQAEEENQRADAARQAEEEMRRAEAAHRDEISSRNASIQVLGSWKRIAVPQSSRRGWLAIVAGVLIAATAAGGSYVLYTVREDHAARQTAQKRADEKQPVDPAQTMASAPVTQAPITTHTPLSSKESGPPLNAKNGIEYTGTYIGRYTATHAHGVKVTATQFQFQQAGTKLAAIYETSEGIRGTGSGTILGDVGNLSLQSKTPTCPGVFEGTLKFVQDRVTFRAKGQDCLGIEEIQGEATKAY
jgi:hypothetical protein